MHLNIVIFRVGLMVRFREKFILVFLQIHSRGKEIRLETSEVEYERRFEKDAVNSRQVSGLDSDKV